MKCDYCGKNVPVTKTLSADSKQYFHGKDVFCSKHCLDTRIAILATYQVKGIIMDKMRALGDKDRQSKYLESLISCLKLDLESLKEEIKIIEKQAIKILKVR